MVIRDELGTETESGKNQYRTDKRNSVPVPVPGFSGLEPFGTIFWDDNRFSPLTIKHNNKNQNHLSGNRIGGADCARTGFWINYGTDFGELQ